MKKTNLDKVLLDLDKLIDKGIKLQLGMLKELNMLKNIENGEEALKEYEPINFVRNYESWYTEAYQVVKQIIPDRLEDFKILYKNDKRKNLEYLNYTVSDYLINVVRKIGNQVIVEREAGYPKFQQQLDILMSAKQRFKSSLFDIKQILQSDLFDSEIEKSKELLKKGFIRAAGAIAGVIIEKHLNQVALNHNLKILKKNPTIGDYNDLLKNNDVYETPTWRFIQRLGDLRNISDHFKEREPTKEEIEELIIGTDKIMKTIY
jgi:hypothetical protein